MIKNIRLLIAYDGSSFEGWQYQQNSRTIQGEIEKAIEKITGRKSRIVCAGRTDAGVHAYGQVANFLTTSEIPGKAFKYHFDQYLPADIEILDSQEEDLDFHARFSAKAKRYRYILYNDKNMHPCLRKYRARYSTKLNVDDMREASKLFLGKHDFKAFMKYGKNENTVRNIDKIEISKIQNEIYFEFEAESFLHNQIRIMVGALVNIGRGHWSKDDLKKVIDDADRQKSSMTFPASGLYLMNIKY
ncbi:MAG: tRNA pseudouridine(38-40) synthase TruA [Tissierellia bacterium]|nr:tRNA pseudouridine(38-40) synthase TruA [Tissierellia bacterium]